MTNRKVRVQVPATTANLGPGFDTLGMALNLYAWIEMGAARETKIRLMGEQIEGIPADKSNLVYLVAQEVMSAAGVHMPELEITMCSDIPLTRGLGSSAAAIVGGMVAANALIGSPLTKEQIFQMATRREKHPDNVGAALFGGIVVTAWDGEAAQVLKIPPHENLEVLAVIPDYQLETKKARGILPQQVPLKDAVYNISRSSLLVASLCSGELGMIRHAMKDVLHQPYRAELIPGMKQILAEAVHHGALGVALSGGGPTLLALVEKGSERKQELEQFFSQTLKQENITFQTKWLKPCLAGARVLTDFDENSALCETIKGDIRA
jgi:homoserine kinase